MGRGQIESASFLIGLVITIAFIAVFILFLSGFFSSGDEQKFNAAMGDFDSIASFYRKCSESPKTDCICGSYDVGSLRKQGYVLYLNKFLGKSNIILAEFGVLPGKDDLIEKDDMLANADFSEELVCTFNYEGFKLTDTSHRVYDLTNSYSDKVTVVKTDSRMCTVSFPDKLGDFRRNFAGCDAALDSDKLVLLDSSDDAYSRQIANKLQEYMLRDVGRVDAFFSREYDGRKEWFDSVYVQEKGGSIAAKSFLVYVRVSPNMILAPDITDKVIVHYLEGSSVSEFFAKAVGAGFEPLKGKYYYNSANESIPGTVPESYKLNINVEYEANNATNPGMVYLACNEDLPVCKENAQIPAAFIEIVDNDDGFSVYHGHEEVIAQAINRAVLGYVRSGAVQEKPSDKRLFQ